MQPSPEREHKRKASLPPSLPKQQKRESPPPPRDIAAFCAGTYGDADMLKHRLRAMNPQCAPRVRSTSGPDGRHVRFNCKRSNVSPHNCSLNVSAIRTVKGGVSWLEPSRNTYVRGSCATAPTCCTCLGDLPGPDIICCEGLLRHHYCRTCFNASVSHQVLGTGRGAFLQNEEVMCTGCTPPTPIPLHSRAIYLNVDIWAAYLAARSEMAVVQEQRRMQALRDADNVAFTASIPASLTPSEQAMVSVRALVLPTCPACNNFLPDFDGCTAIKCGAICIDRDGAHGCGTRLCGWCLRVCTSQDHSNHVSYCEWNPKQGNVFPESVAVWRSVHARLARDRIYKKIATLPKGVASEVIALVHTEFPDLPGFGGSWNAAGGIAASHTPITILDDESESAGASGSARALRASPAPPPPHFIANIQLITDMGIASRAEAMRTLEACGNDIAEAVALLLAAASLPQ